MIKLDAFAITVYRTPEVADACLTLQQELGLDVPVLLFCAWYAGTCGELDEKMLSQVIERSGPFSLQVVQPLRQIRRWMKQPAEAQESINFAVNHQAWHSLRETIKSIEISAELLWLEALQNMAELHNMCPKSTNLREDNAMKNMQRYCQTFKTAAERDTLSVNELITRIAVAGKHLHVDDKSAQSL